MFDAGVVALVVFGLLILVLAGVVLALVTVLRRARPAVTTDSSGLVQDELEAARREADNIRERATIEAADIAQKAEASSVAAQRTRQEAEDEIRALKDDVRELRIDLERREHRLAEREERLDSEQSRVEERDRELFEVEAAIDRKRAELDDVERNDASSSSAHRGADGGTS